MELARAIVSRLRRYIGDRRHSTRKKARLPFSIVVAGPAKSVNGSRQTRILEGHTLDISPAGMSLIVPAIRIGEYHLIGENRGFGLKLKLPAGTVDMEVAPVRYESLEDHQTETGFLIGVKIVDMPDADRVTFAQYVSGLINDSNSR
ncbi:MAG TPA: PilZ domain-containing protein [Pyrinomonadaceae bacterium]|nr:PilZ domain-containing protein [Pyrinomonadaceae bacterium]